LHAVWAQAAGHPSADSSAACRSVVWTGLQDGPIRQADPCNCLAEQDDRVAYRIRDAVSLDIEPGPEHWATGDLPGSGTGRRECNSQVGKKVAVYRWLTGIPDGVHID
jgi:hypothetical protein